MRLLIVTGWQFRLQNNIIIAAGRPFAEGAYTPPGILETVGSVPFAMPSEVGKQTTKRLKK
jgi:hypothetical protein